MKRLEEAEGGDFADTESDEGRDLVRALASRSPRCGAGWALDAGGTR